MSTKDKGISFEVWVASKLKELGYDVTLTPQSRDFGADIIAKKDGRKIAVQVKNTKKPVGVHAIQEALGGKEYYGCHEAWVVSKSGFTQSARELAEISGVQLMTGYELERLANAMKDLHSGRIDRNKISWNRGMATSVAILLILSIVLVGVSMVHYNTVTNSGSRNTVLGNYSSPLEHSTVTTTSVSGSTTSGNLKMPQMELSKIRNSSILFFDGFERYPVGSTLTSAEGWFLVWNGKSFEQKIVRGIAAYGNKSLQLWGDPCVNAGFERYLYFNGTYLRLRNTNYTIGLETYVGAVGYGDLKCSSHLEKNPTVALVGFWNSYEKRYYAVVVFKHDGGIYANGVKIGTWKPGIWYDVRISMAWWKGTFNVYINGHHVGSSISIHEFSAPGIYDGVLIVSGHAGVKVFFDNFTIFKIVDNKQ